MGATRWPPERVARLVEAAKAGRDAAAVAAELGVTKRTLHSRAWRGVKGEDGIRRRIRFRRHRWGRGTDAKLRILVKEGATRAEAAEELGFGEASVSRNASRLGLRFLGCLPDPFRQARIVGLVQRGANSGGKLARLLGVSRQAANAAVRGLLCSGVLCRVRVGRSTRLVVGDEWGTRT